MIARRRAEYVRTADDSVLRRNRGCGDVVVYGCLFPFVLLAVLLGLAIYATS